jgi:hypothetical protein
MTHIEPTIAAKVSCVRKLQPPILNDHLVLVSEMLLLVEAVVAIAIEFALDVSNTDLGLVAIEDTRDLLESWAPVK